MASIFGILESSSTQLYQDVTPTEEFFFIVTSIVYGFDKVTSYKFISAKILINNNAVRVRCDTQKNGSRRCKQSGSR
jgi:hypothetical protein